ncbi:MAG: Clp protease N-terminal domain-containing protein [Solirubrobacteraceae bacterium]|nr:Clp protease N-terminal domain-containing protein [Solirubrobacteraceae bacterium]
MFERFTREARQVVVGARRAARRLGAEQVESEHLLLALAESDTAAARALVELGLDDQVIAEAIEADLVAMLDVVGVPASVVGAVPALPRADQPGYSVHAKQALEHALREAVARGDRRLGAEHILLGTLRPPSPTLARLLARHAVAPERLAALVQVEVAAGRR